MDPLRRILSSLLVFILAALLFGLLLRGNSNGYGLIDLLRGKPAPEEPSTSQEPSLHLASSSPIPPSEVPLLTRLDEEYALLASRTIPSVVSINTVRSGSIPRLYIGPSGFQRGLERFQQPGLGSGVIVSKEGHVITNHHVIEGVDGIQITTNDGTAYRASIIGSDPVLDIAVLKINAEEVDFPPLPFGDSDKAQVGQSILAVGNPFDLSGTVTRGIISAKERSLSDDSPELLQTDAVINPGNSGGPLINTRGQIIGINVAIYKGQEGLDVWQGVGLAIPSNSVRDSFTTIMNRGRPIFGYLGVSVGREVVSGGVAITDVAEGSPAEKADLQRGDRVLSFQGKPVDTAEDFLRNVLRSPVGEAVELLVLRKNDKVTLNATIQERPSNPPSRQLEAPEEAVESIAKSLGIRCRNLTTTEMIRVGTFPSSPGVCVVDVLPHSPFGTNLSEGDLIQQINQLPIGDVSALQEALAALPRDQTARMFVINRGQKRSLRFVPQEASR